MPGPLGLISLSLSLARTIDRPPMPDGTHRGVAGSAYQQVFRRNVGGGNASEDEAPGDESKFGWLGSARRRRVMTACSAYSR